MSKPDWIEEIQQDIFGTRFKVTEHLFSARSQFQQIDIVNTSGFGRMLLNDGLVMLSERDEFIYHEMIAHVPLFVHPQPQRVLIIGGGDGGTAREVIRHNSVERCVLVEIDKVVVESCQQFIPQTAMALKDPRVTVKIQDGVDFVANTEEQFDIVLIDSTDPIGPAQPLFGKDFYTNVNRILSPNGIVVAQAENPFFALDVQLSMLKVLAEVFPRLHLYNFSNICYPGGLWSLAFASRTLCPLNNFNEQRVAAANLTFKYYNVHVHRAAFALPQFMFTKLGAHLSPLKLKV